MSTKERVQDEIKAAMKNKDSVRLECLRMVKAALLLKEKESAAGLTEESALAAVRGELKKRQQSLEIFKELGKGAEAAATENEIAIIGEFLPTQLSEPEIEARVRAYLAEHPEMNHAGKLTGALKKELGDQADGRLLNDICKRVLEG
ncbi:MAG: GatB/YqeY domain-containing protein [Candidatus Hydrogenedentes bacterium]|nr:GatB/YqeY domain-containing protein [Candidatus Hydrogenedentota bacterium]